MFVTDVIVSSLTVDAVEVGVVVVLQEVVSCCLFVTDVIVMLNVDAVGEAVVCSSCGARRGGGAYLYSSFPPPFLYKGHDVACIQSDNFPACKCAPAPPPPPGPPPSPPGPPSASRCITARLVSETTSLPHRYLVTRERERERERELMGYTSIYTGDGTPHQHPLSRR